MLEEDLWD